MNADTLFSRIVEGAAGRGNPSAVPGARPRPAEPQHRGDQGAGSRMASRCGSSTSRCRRCPCWRIIRSAFPTRQFMSFHLPISAAVLNAFPDRRPLAGKTDAGCRRPPRSRQRRALAKPRAGVRIVWLIDTDERLAAYAALADELGRDLRICFEVDVGLHRGGYPDPTRWRARLRCWRTIPG